MVFENQNKSLIAAAALGFGAVATGAIVMKQILAPKWKKVGVVDDLVIFPVKSGRGKSVPKAEFLPMGMKAGLFQDRTFCIVREGCLTYVAIKEIPQITQLELVFYQGKLRLRAPDFGEAVIEASDLEFSPEKQLKISMLSFKKIKSIRVNEECNRLISEFLLGSPEGLIFVYHYSDRPERPMNPKYTKVWPNLKDSNAPAFGYNTAFSLSTWSSLNDLNNRLEHSVDPRCFRSNIIISTDSDEPFQEDKWTGRIRLGKNVILLWDKPCHRCLDINVNPDNGTKYENHEPLKTLRQYRQISPNQSKLDAARRKVIGDSPLFALNLSLDKGGVVDVGDEVYVEV